MGTKQGYAITTWRLRLRCKHPEWLETTQNFYNEIQKFYYDLYLERPELWNENSQNALRGLETLSIPNIPFPGTMPCCIFVDPQLMQRLQLQKAT